MVFSNPEERLQAWFNWIWKDYASLLHEARTPSEVKRAWEVTERRLDRVRERYQQERLRGDSEGAERFKAYQA